MTSINVPDYAYKIPSTDKELTSLDALDIQLFVCKHDSIAKIEETLYDGKDAGFWRVLVQRNNKTFLEFIANEENGRGAIFTGDNQLVYAGLYDNTYTEIPEKNIDKDIYNLFWLVFWKGRVDTNKNYLKNEFRNRKDSIVKYLLATHYQKIKH